MFLPGGNDAEEVGFYLLAWAQRRLAGVVDEERTKVRARVKGGEVAGILVELVASIGTSHQLDVLVETDASGDAIRYRFNLHTSVGGPPAACGTVIPATVRTAPIIATIETP